MSNALALLKVAGISVITVSADIDKESKNLAKAIGTQDKRIAAYLFSEMLHIEEHRNTTRLNTFFTNIRETGARVNAMHSFVQAYFNVRFNDQYNKDAGKATFEKDGYFPYYTMRDKRDEKMLETKVTAAIAKPWWKHQPERPVTNFDMSKKIEDVISSLWRAAQSATEGDKLEMDFLNELTTLAVKHGHDFGKLVPTISNEKLTQNVDVRKHLTVIRAEHSNVPGKEDKAPAATETKSETPIVQAKVETKGRGKKAA